MYKGMFYNPRCDLRNLRKDIHRVVNDVLENESEWEGNYWQPPIDVVESDNAFIVAVELPGLNKEDIKINIHENAITINGEKKPVTEENQRLHSEFWYRPFRRTINLPGEINREKISARYENGILQVTLPKMEKSTAKEIKIDVK